MKISVLIPAYNSAATIRATLESVLCQTTAADEILVMDDGSTDQTAAILGLYEPRIKVFSQPNGGVSSARNALIARATGDLVAFLDSDDLWHPSYLKTQLRVFELYPEAAALFIGHETFTGLGSYQWEDTGSGTEPRVEMLDPANFSKRFRIAPGHFIMSFCCVPQRVLEGMGSQPSKLRVAEDVYFCHSLPFWGPVAFTSAPLLGAYRGREGSLASNRLNCAAGEVTALELLEMRYKNVKDRRLVREFERTFPSKRRAFAKMLLGAERTSEARHQLRRAIDQSGDPISLFKSVGLLSLSCFPRALQPKWPSMHRQ
jgi:glycosyltransferase involved in cell wall biosynthesis